MTNNAMLVFNYLKDHPGQEFTKQDIAAALDITVQAVTGTTNSLRKKGYSVERTEVVTIPGVDGKADKTKNVVYVMLTDAGLAYDPVAEEEAMKAEKARIKEEKALAKAAAKAATADAE